MLKTIKTIVKSGENQWKDKTLVKWFVQFTDETNGTLTTGFDETPPPKEGEEIECEIVETNFGTEVKLPRKAGFKGGGQKWSTEQIAQQDSIKLTCAYIEAGNDLKFWKQFFVEAKEFMIHSIDGKSVEVSEGVEAIEPVDKDDPLPF